ncbi:hypothetical protein C8Q77DRAFT_1158063 [Trametes polyzona]|nr:hypothetical protein C8Q77DRAFT_1158063 [Trametes polyzona]
MASSDPGSTAEVIELYSSLRASYNVLNATTAVILYDVILTLPKEMRYVWFSPRKWHSRGLYVLNRYMYLVYSIISMGAIPPVTDRRCRPLPHSRRTEIDNVPISSCAAISWSANVALLIASIAPSAFTTLRVYALSEKSKIYGGALLAVGLFLAVVNTVSLSLDDLHIHHPELMTMVQDVDSVLRTAQSSSSTKLRGNKQSGPNALYQILGILGLFLAVFVTWRATRVILAQLPVSSRPPSLQQVMWKNGNVYFCTLATLNVIDMVLIALSLTTQPNADSYVGLFLSPITSILNGRFLLDLFESHARLSDGGANSSFSVHLSRVGDTDGMPQLQRSLELPEFLTPLGGPLHPFDEDGVDVIAERSTPAQRPHDIGDTEAGIHSDALEGTGDVL